MTQQYPFNRKLGVIDDSEERVFKYLIQIGKTHPEIEKIILFGSRARRTHKPRSDFDIAIFAPNLADEGWAALALNIEEFIPSLCGLDLVHLKPKQQSPLQDSILREGIEIYVRKN